jgi:hypothetical protein
VASSPKIYLFIALLCASVPAMPVQGAGSQDITAVSSRVYNGYKRILLPDGSPRPETYGFAIGGELNKSSAGTEGLGGLPTADRSIDGIAFAEISSVIRGPLAGQKYLPTGDPKTANLLIVVYWGRTIGTNAFEGTTSAAVNGGDRDKIDLENARLLGFDSEKVFDLGYDDHANMMANIRREVYAGVMDAIEDDRYFVILRAYDFPMLWKQRQAKLLWETRFSLSQRHHDFRLDLPAMTQVAAEYFGKDSLGLVQKPIPEGNVDIGETKNLGEVPAK